MTAVLPSPESATRQPGSSSYVQPVGFSGFAWVQLEPVRVNARTDHGALFNRQLTRAVVPAAERDTPQPNRGRVFAEVRPVHLAPCCAQVLPEELKTQAAPPTWLSYGPPIRAVPPSPESATLFPNWAAPRSSLATSFLPCCAHFDPARL